jgi:hypothetical protein
MKLGSTIMLGAVLISQACSPTAPEVAAPSLAEANELAAPGQIYIAVNMKGETTIAVDGKRMSEREFCDYLKGLQPSVSAPAEFCEAPQ